MNEQPKTEVRLWGISDKDGNKITGAMHSTKIGAWNELVEMTRGKRCEEVFEEISKRGYRAIEKVYKEVEGDK